MTPVQIRKLRGKLSQEQFAKKIGAGRASVARWELGVSKPTGLYLQALEKLQAAVKKRRGNAKGLR